MTPNPPDETSKGTTVHSRYLPLALPGLLLAACGAEAPTTTPSAVAIEERFPMVVDSCGDEVQIEADPTRILTVGTTAVNILTALGKADLIVARTGEFGAQLSGDAATAAGAADVITDEDPTKEQIIGSGADLVIGYGLFNTDSDQLAAAGIPSLVTAGECGHDGQDKLAAGFPAVFQDLNDFGDLLGAEEQASAVTNDLEDRLSAVQASVADEEPLSAAAVYFFLDALSINGNKSIVHAQLDQIGVTNVFGDLDESFVEGSREELIKSDPDLLVLSYGFSGETFEEAREQLLKVPGIDAMRAVKDDRIVGIPVDQRDPDPSAIEGVELLASEIYGS
jgi:iron complex transport system substrate-binding protein